ncbi:hypothetical protein C8Q80DRAFT_1110607 [Daedaleopsis nitida]|nr:hypothetical protein C8Q80DRAFT_1110607 [Daedaleopsis nitida]
MGAATPKKGRTPALLPSRSLIEMRDKTTWQITDDIPLWDTRHLFKTGLDCDTKFSHDTVASLPRLERELQFGEVAIIYYSASTFLPSKNIHPDAVHGLSLNLYGAVSIASEV